MPPSLHRPLLAFVILGLALLALPEPLANVWRTTTRDFLKPGQQIAALAGHSIAQLRARSLGSELAGRDAEINALRDRVAQQETALHAQTALALYHHDQSTVTSTVTSSLPAATSSERLFVPELITAAVLGEELSTRWRQGTLLDQGSRQKATESAWVLKDAREFVDLGETDGLSPADAVLCGRQVVGKLSRVGRLTSTLIRVSDPDFRCPGRLVRVGSTGVRELATGVLIGTGGKTARFDGVAENDSVRVGDQIFTTVRDGLSPLSFYLGTVRQAEVQSDHPTWSIEVDVASGDRPLTRVAILRLGPNSRRLDLANTPPPDRSPTDSSSESRSLARLFR